ncbi:MAG: hypothetical protein WAV20_03105 [Blastocatellia bacterium]
MMSCNHIKKRIDQADKPDRLPFDVTEHIAHCSDCERFAWERAGLRNLLGSSVRVNAPINFDAMLKSRLAQAKARPSFSWFGAPGYLRLGAAAAGLVIMIGAAQYSGLLSDNSNGSRGGQVISETPITKQDSPLATAKPAVVPSVADSASSGGDFHQPVSYTPAPRPRVKRSDIDLSRQPIPEGYLTAEDGGVVLVRGHNGEMDVPMPTVSVGAQPLLYVSTGQRASRNVGTSF